jgi:hypothetical protein
MTTAFKHLTIAQATDRAVTDKNCVILKVRIDLWLIIWMGFGLKSTKQNMTTILACDEMKSKHSSYAHGRHSSVQS